MTRGNCGLVSKTGLCVTGLGANDTFAKDIFMTEGKKLPYQCVKIKSSLSWS